MKDSSKKQFPVKWNNIDTLNKYSFPERNANVLFYLRATHTVRIGQFRDNQFVAYSTHIAEDGKSFYVNETGSYSVNDVDCFINIKDIKPLFSKEYENKYDETYDSLVIVKYLIGEMDDFYTIFNDSTISIKDNENQEYLRLPKLPEYCHKQMINVGKYYFEFCDDQNGFFTYNVFKKKFFGLIRSTVYVSEHSCRAIAFEDGYNKFKELVK